VIDASRIEDRMPRTVLVAPAGRDVGLSTVCLGLVRALDRQGVRVAFVKPVAAPGEVRSVPLMKLAARLQPPEPISRQTAEQLLAAGDDRMLVEQVVAICSRSSEGADVLVVEGMVPEWRMAFSTRVNALVMRALDAELLLVGSPREQTPSQIAEAVAIAARGYGPPTRAVTVGCVLNRVCIGPARSDYDCEDFGPLYGECGDCRGFKPGRIEGEAYTRALEAEELRPLAIVPCAKDLAAPRVRDVAVALGARALREGDHARRRVRNVVMCGMTVQNAARYFKPGVLVITPGDRSDIVLAAALAVQGGTAVAGLLLTGGLVPGEDVLALCQPAFDAGLPVLALEDGSYAAAAKIGAMSQEIPVDDVERVELSADFVADKIEPAWLESLAGGTRVPRLSPPAFRHRLFELARAAGKRIVLPEGSEPRTIAAACIAQARGIARCLLMGKPDEIREVARKQGVTLTPSIELLDVAKVGPSYLAALVERGKTTPELALRELDDSVMVGTMMMALGEADGLVSGALHTRAHTIQPALRIIGTVPGRNLVSSVLFMCLPDQVLVFGDCAVNPNPTAEELADIAIQSAESARAFGIPPRVAMLAGSGSVGDESRKVERATELAKALRPDLAIDGPLQYDVAIMPGVARQKAPGSPVAGKATVFIFPDLDTGDVAREAVQRSGNAVSIGPMMQGLAKPVNDLGRSCPGSRLRSCQVEDIVLTIALTAIQAEHGAAREKAGT
jgi:phosphate acetyltransferase